MVQLIVLASGNATRFGDFLAKGEKHLLPLINGEPILSRSISNFSKMIGSDLARVIVVVRNDNVALYSGTLTKWLNGFKIYLVENDKFRITNNSYTLSKGLNFVLSKRYLDDTIIINGDIVFMNSGSKIRLRKDIMLGGIISFESRPDSMRAFVRDNIIKYIGFDISNNITFYNFLGLYINREALNEFYYSFDDIARKFEYLSWYESVLNVLISNNTIEMEAIYLPRDLKWDEIDDPTDYARVLLTERIIRG